MLSTSKKISLGNRFAFLKDGPKVYNTNTTFVYNDNMGSPMSETVQKFRKARIIDTAGNRLGIMIFLGANSLLENSVNIYEVVAGYENKPWDAMNITIVVPSQKDKDRILKKGAAAYSKKARSFWKKVDVMVNASAFATYNVIVTPSVVAAYKADKKTKMVWQNIGTGIASPESVKDATIRFLVYNDIIKPVEMATAISAADYQKNMRTAKPVFHAPKQ